MNREPKRQTERQTDRTQTDRWALYLIYIDIVNMRFLIKMNSKENRLRK